MPGGGEFFFLVQDVAAFAPTAGKTVNVLFHMWAYPELAGGQRYGYADLWEAGAFSWPGSGVRPLQKVDLAFQQLSPHAIHIHPQRGGMACSPNNGRVELTGEPVSWSSITALLFLSESCSYLCNQ